MPHASVGTRCTLSSAWLSDDSFNQQKCAYVNGCNHRSFFDEIVMSVGSDVGPLCDVV